MSQFVRITGANMRETPILRLAPAGWFSNACNASGGQIGHIPLDAETASIRRAEKVSRVYIHAFALFLAYSCGFKRVFDPVYESVT